MKSLSFAVLIASTASLISSPASAYENQTSSAEPTAASHHDHSSDGHHHQAAEHDHSAMSSASNAGRPGKEANVQRTIEVVAQDRMHFEHAPIEVKAGETVRFVVTNQGQLVHEFSIGTTGEHQAHQAMMRSMPNMQHNDKAMLTLQPGETKTLIWTFAKAENIEIACNIPGHYEAGMHSAVEID